MLKIRAIKLPDSDKSLIKSNVLASYNLIGSAHLP